MKTIQSLREERRLLKRAVHVEQVAVVMLKDLHLSSLPALPRMSLSDKASLRSMWSRRTLVI
jgi:hypothetical protein